MQSLSMSKTEETHNRDSLNGVKDFFDDICALNRFNKLIYLLFWLFGQENLNRLTFIIKIVVVSGKNHPSSLCATTRTIS